MSEAKAGRRPYRLQITIQADSPVKLSGLLRELCQQWGQGPIPESDSGTTHLGQYELRLTRPEK